MQQFSVRTSAEENSNTAAEEQPACLPLQRVSEVCMKGFTPPPPSTPDAGRPGVAVQQPTAAPLSSSKGHLILHYFVAPSVALKFIFQFLELLQQIYFFLPPLCEKVSHNPFHRRRLASQQGAGESNQASARSCRCVFNRPCKSSQVTVMAFPDLLPNFKQQSGCPTAVPKCCQE